MTAIHTDAEKELKRGSLDIQTCNYTNLCLHM